MGYVYFILKYPDRTNPVENHAMVLASSKYGISPEVPVTPQMFGAAGREHMEKYGEFWLGVGACGGGKGRVGSNTYMCDL